MWLRGSRRRQQARVRLSKASRDAEKAKTRLLEKPGGPKAEELHERKTTSLQVYKSTRLQGGGSLATGPGGAPALGRSRKEDDDRTEDLPEPKREGDYTPAAGVSRGWSSIVIERCDD